MKKKQQQLAEPVRQVRPIRLYPQVVVSKQSFKGTKVCTLPDQSITLKEIIKRFLRKEALPISKEGLYEDRMGDLEKLANEDITVQMERAQELKATLKKAQKQKEDHDNNLKAEAEAKVKADREQLLRDLKAQNDPKPDPKT